MRTPRTIRFVLPALFLAAHAASAGILPPPDYGFQWCTVGAEGNRGTLPSETPRYYGPPLGSVPYTFRMAKTEITVGQWVEFVNAYLPYYHGSPENVVFTGPQISIFNGHASAGGNVNAPTYMSWEYAARYCNWLNNGKALTEDAFNHGAYDASTFTRNPDGSYNHNLTRSPDAQFWIPSLDEWIKGAYYDPNKYGTGLEGYWYHPSKSGVPLISGPPSAGGQTNAGPNGGPSSVGSYPNAPSPWGVLDMSGGENEWTSSPLNPFEPHYPAFKGSRHGSAAYVFNDRLDQLSSNTPDAAYRGVRIASAVPSPGTTLMPGCFLALCLKRRRSTAAPR